MKQKTRIQWLGMAKICSRRPGFNGWVWPRYEAEDQDSNGWVWPRYEAEDQDLNGWYGQDMKQKTRIQWLGMAKI